MAQLRGEEKVRYVEAMFARIARRYDVMNTLMTGGMHHGWKGLTARLAAEGQQGRALDIASGTGDLAFALARQPGIRQAVGLDLVSEMVRLAQYKARRDGLSVRTAFLVGDALDLPFPAGAFVCVTSGFSLRNVADYRRMFAETHRVLAPCGRIALLETTPLPPRGLRPALIRFYQRRVIPLMGAIFARDREAYTYLPTTSEAFAPPASVAAALREAGFGDVRWRLAGFGTVAIHTGVKPA
ncbi:MAG: ubiquinone/menaquinone biosynthesis methyltransferase [Dehalococcoidia bacterium]|nr:ubiquinone/menaquinone biosynthesis methyltransferase [Dehalococcoidia bacterium]